MGSGPKVCAAGDNGDGNCGDDSWDEDSNLSAEEGEMGSGPDVCAAGPQTLQSQRSSAFDIYIKSIHRVLLRICTRAGR